MVAWWWLLVASTAGTLAGFWLCAMFTVANRADEANDRMMNEQRKREEQR